MPFYVQTPRKSPPKMTHFGPKTMHDFPVRTPICHIAPISRIYGGGGGVVQNGIYRTLKCTFGVSGFRGSARGPGDCQAKDIVPALLRSSDQRHSDVRKIITIGDEIIQGGPGTKPEPETGTARNRFRRNRNRNRNRPPCETVLNHTKTPRSRNCRNRKPEPLEPFHPQAVTEPNRTGATLIISCAEKIILIKSCKETGLHYSYEFPHSTERKTVTVNKIVVPSKEDRRRTNVQNQFALFSSLSFLLFCSP